MSEQLLIRHCSPTLAGMKTGNIFTCPYRKAVEVKEYVRSLNRRLRHKGLRILPLRYSEDRALIYVYRPDYLSRDLLHITADSILRERGYPGNAPEKCILHLISRLQNSEAFPHKIGLFLGYPPEDVYGFIENKPDSCKCVGHWKVYGDEAIARRTFEKYRKCTDVYSRHWAEGTTLEKLTVNSTYTGIRQYHLLDRYH